MVAAANHEAAEGGFFYGRRHLASGRSRGLRPRGRPAVASDDDAAEQTETQTRGQMQMEMVMGAQSGRDLLLGGSAAATGDDGGFIVVGECVLSV